MWPRDITSESTAVTEHPANQISCRVEVMPSSMPNIKMFGPSSHTGNKMFVPVLLGGRGSTQEMPGTLRLDALMTPL